MMVFKRMGVLILVSGVLVAQQSALPPVEDPVLKIQAARAASPGSNDLPPVPRGILEPPPLPPPVTHVRDTPRYRATRTPVRRTSRKVVKKPIRKKVPKKAPKKTS